MVVKTVYRCAALIGTDYRNIELWLSRKKIDRFLNTIGKLDPVFGSWIARIRLRRESREFK